MDHSPRSPAALLPFVGGLVLAAVGNVALWPRQVEGPAPVLAFSVTWSIGCLVVGAMRLLPRSRPWAVVAMLVVAAAFGLALLLAAVEPGDAELPVLLAVVLLGGAILLRPASTPPGPAGPAGPAQRD